MSGNKDPWNGPVTAGDEVQDQTVLVWDIASNAPTNIPLSQYAEAVASGKVRPYEQTVVRTERLGAQVYNTPEQAGAALAGGERPVSPTQDYVAGVQEQQREAFDTLSHKVFTFGEAVVDGLSSGLIRERGKRADLRRDVNAGSAFAGNLTALALSLANPASAAGRAVAFTPAAKIARSSEAAGKAAAKQLFGEAVKGERVVTAMGRRAVAEAVPNAALAGAAALGHGVTDTLIEDKPFAAEHISSEVGVGALVGGAFGAGATLLGKAASKIKAREYITKQGGI